MPSGSPLCSSVPMDVASHWLLGNMTTLKSDGGRELGTAFEQTGEGQWLTDRGHHPRVVLKGLCRQEFQAGRIRLGEMDKVLVYVSDGPSDL